MSTHDRRFKRRGRRYAKYIRRASGDAHFSSLISSIAHLRTSKLSFTLNFLSAITLVTFTSKMRYNFAILCATILSVGFAAAMPFPPVEEGGSSGGRSQGTSYTTHFASPPRTYEQKAVYEPGHDAANPAREYATQLFDSYYPHIQPPPPSNYVMDYEREVSLHLGQDRSISLFACN
jgi:hypothetical protein